MSSYTHTTWNGWRAPVSGIREWSIKCASSRMTTSQSPTRVVAPSRSSISVEQPTAPSTRAVSSPRRIPLVVGERVVMQPKPGVMPQFGVLRSISHTAEGISVEVELQTLDGKRLGWTHGTPDDLGLERA
jgi:hypothetical protein